jgi:DNA polymerase-2
MRGFILTPTYRLRNGIPEIHLYGVLETGQPFLILEDRQRPHFFVRQSDAARLRQIAPSVNTEETDLRTFNGDAALRVVAAIPADVPPLRARLEKNGVDCFEADVRFAYRLLIDRGIRGSLEIDGEHSADERLGLVFRNPEIAPTRWAPKLRVLSIDIETDPKAEKVFSIALHGPDIETVLLVGDRRVRNAEPVADERALLTRFLELLDEVNPDVITGWNVVDFDLTVLLKVARRCGVRLTIGRSKDEFDCRRDGSFTRESRAVIFGRLVLDGLSLMRGAFYRLADYRLETAAQSVLGRGKLMHGDDRAEAIEAAYRDEPQRFVDYNLEDARLVSEILERTGLIELAVERSLLTGMPPDRVSAAIASVDSLYLGALRERGIVAPSVGRADRETRIAGGYVMDSKPGLYRNILVFDFKSLYPSIIRTFNLDPLSLVRDPNEKGDFLRAPNGARFRRDEKGILPDLVATLATEREAAKRSGKSVQSNAIKILMNSMYGVLGAGASRLFSPDVANAITHFGQQLIQKAAEIARDRGFEVLYGDTDSLFINPDEDDAQQAIAVAEKLRRTVGDGVAEFVRGTYRSESFLELEFEKIYHRFLLPEVRGGKTGSKKRYAGLICEEDGGEHVEFVGLESVRRDWSEVSKRFQRGLLDLVFHDRAVEEFIRSFLSDLRAGRYDDELAYRKAIRKGLDSYTKTTPPHVQAARKQRRPTGSIISYMITKHGPEPTGEETAPPDYEHYIEHQIEPIAEAVLSFLGTDFASAADTKRQLALF